MTAAIQANEWGKVMNETEAARRALLSAISSQTVPWNPQEVVEAIEKLIDAKLDDFDDLLRERSQ